VEAQRLSVEADQEALTALLRRQMGERWVLWRFRDKDRLVLDQPRVEVLPGGIYLSGRLRSLTPELDTIVELRVTPRILGSSLRLSAEDVTVLRPSGALGYLPRRVIQAYLRSEAGREELERFSLDLSPILRELGKPHRVRLRLRLGFGSLRLILAVK